MHAICFGFNLHLSSSSVQTPLNLFQPYLISIIIIKSVNITYRGVLALNLIAWFSYISLQLGFVHFTIDTKCLVPLVERDRDNVELQFHIIFFFVIKKRLYEIIIPCYFYFFPIREWQIRFFFLIFQFFTSEKIHI